MIKESLNDLIKNAMINKNRMELETLRAIKTAFMNWETAKNAQPLDDTAEIKIIKKLISQRNESIEQFKLAGRADLVEKEMAEINVLNKFLPEPIKEDEIKAFAQTLITPETGKRDMGRIVKEVKTKFPIAEGKLVADIVKKLIE